VDALPVAGGLMRFHTFFVSFVRLAGALSLVPIPATLAQVRQPVPMAVATEDLPDAPEPHYLAINAESVDEQAVAGQNRNVPGVKGGKHDSAQHPPSALVPSAANISGSVTDVNGNVIPAAAIVLEGPDTSDRQTIVTDQAGAFQSGGLKAGVPYLITVRAKGFENWRSPPLVLNPAQHLQLQDIKLKLPASVTSVTVYAYPEQIATQQVIIEEHQRVLGVFPNFYVTYNPEAVPLTTKLKFRLAFKADTDVMTFVGVAFMSAVYQAGDIPDYGQGWDAYGKRMAAGYADTTTDIFIGGAILPWLLHQDPRYFYQGTGTKKSRARHAMLSPFICKGDNGKPQPNYSSLAGDLASGAISNFYYPESNRGAGLVFQGFLVTTGVRMANGLVQEFIFRKLTPSAKKQH
jgi:hypothetical protein